MVGKILDCEPQALQFRFTQNVVVLLLTRSFLERSGPCTKYMEILENSSEQVKPIFKHKPIQ